MRFHREARCDAYDVIVVGAGIGALSAAALIARSSKSVLVVERHDRPGGYAHAFRRSRYLFDSAVHLVGGCEPVNFEGGALVDRLLRRVGVRDRCDFVKVDPVYSARFPGLEVRAPSGLEEFVEAHCRAFPGEEKGLRQLVQECLNVRVETRNAAELEAPMEVVHQPDRFPTLLRYRRATLADVLRDCIGDPRAAAAVSTLWPYLGLPPSRVSFLYFATMLMSYIADGAFYCRGTFQQMADALAHAVESEGGELLYRSPVRRIIVHEGKARGVVLENGQRVEAPVVISGADLLQTVEELVGEREFPRRYHQKLQRMRPSISAFVVYAATDLDLRASGLGHETFVYQSEDHDDAYRSVLAGSPNWLSLTLPTLADPGLAPPGEHLLTLTTLVPYGAVASWRAEKQRYTDRMLAAAEAQLPGLRDHLLFVEAGTPRTMERYTRNQGGAIYGWELSPSQVGPVRPAFRTPVEGLLLAGHWTAPGGGIYGVVNAGIRAAQEVLDLPNESQLWS